MNERLGTGLLRRSTATICLEGQSIIGIESSLVVQLPFDQRRKSGDLLTNFKTGSNSSLNYKDWNGLKLHRLNRDNNVNGLREKREISKMVLHMINLWYKIYTTNVCINYYIDILYQ